MRRSSLGFLDMNALRVTFEDTIGMIGRGGRQWFI